MAKDQLLAAQLAARHGVVSREWLQHCGFTVGEIRQMRESGRLVDAHRGVYRSTSAPRTQQQRMVELVLYCDGVISHATAGQLWGLRKLSRYRQIHLSIMRGERRRPSGSGLDEVVLHATTDLPPTDIVQRADGISLTSAARTVFDLASIVSAEDLESIIEHGLSRGLFTVPVLAAVRERLAKPGRIGAKRFGCVLAAREPAQKPVDSDHELRLVTALEASGLPRLQRQMPLRLLGGELVHPDLAEPSRRFIVEVDHATWHSRREASQYDRWRDRQYHLLGWHSERVSDRDIDERLPETVQELFRIYRALPSIVA
jgi:very-short-patch-repair endonuclease